VWRQEGWLEISRYGECFFKTNFKPPWMRSVQIPDVRNKGCSIPYPSGGYLEAVQSSLRKWMNPDCGCCLGILTVTLFASMNLMKAIISDEVSTKTWCHINKTFQKNFGGEWREFGKNQPKFSSQLDRLGVETWINSGQISLINELSMKFLFCAQLIYKLSTHILSILEVPT